MADVLEQQQADGFRIAAYRRAAGTVESLTSSIADIAHADGLSGLMALPAIGRGIALAIMEMLSTGGGPAARSARPDGGDAPMP